MKTFVTFIFLAISTIVNAQEKKSMRWWQNLDEDKVYLIFSSNFGLHSPSFTLQRFRANYIAWGYSYGAGVELQPEDHSIHPKVTSRVWAWMLAVDNSLICYYPGPIPEVRWRTELGFTLGGIVAFQFGKDFRLVQGKMNDAGLKSTSFSIIVPFPVYNVKTGKWGMKT